MNQETLEQQSLWYQYKTAVWPRASGQKTEVSGQMAVVHNIMRVLRAIRNQGGLAYVSVPITSGKYLYELKLQDSTARTQSGAGALLERAISHNYHEGWGFTKTLAGRLKCPILFPADLVPVHQKWEQVHFQALWLSIIAEKCTEMHMSRGWEYSNGGSEEFTHAMQLQLGLPRHHDLLFYNDKEEEGAERMRMRNIVAYDHTGKELSCDDGIAAIERSLRWIKNHQFEAPKLERCLALLQWTKQKLHEGFYQ